MEKCLQANFQAGAYATCAAMRFRARALSTLPSKHTQKFLVAKSPADLHFDISNAIWRKKKIKPKSSSETKTLLTLLKFFGNFQILWKCKAM